MLFVRKEEQVLGAFDHPRVELIPAALLARPRALRIAAVAPSTIMRPERVASRCAAWLVARLLCRVDGDIRILLGNETGAPSALPSVGSNPSICRSQRGGKAEVMRRPLGKTVFSVVLLP